MGSFGMYRDKIYSVILFGTETGIEEKKTFVFIIFAMEARLLRYLKAE